MTTTAFPQHASHATTSPACLQPHAPPQPAMKEIKVNVPRAFHIQLHAVRILTGKRLSDIVTEALTTYFQDVPADESSQALLRALGHDVPVPAVAQS